MTTRYIALLRGINVSGQKIIKMEDLRGMFEALKFKQVKTYIQSGNVIFESPEADEQLLLKKIHARLERDLGYAVNVFLRSTAEMEAVVAHHPYGTIQPSEDRKLYIAFLHEAPSKALQEAFLAFQSEQERFYFHNREVYIASHKEMEKPVFTNMFLEKKLKTVATTRNWATVNKVLHI
ncbi:DUF1697 domain-containing protein [Chitinophaga vietnamensis]|uniref:DUF1697 domain-containing protein n=1 Tax=Chitinophaga vietnamensis TaxID=2593957 RepID=UPI00117842E3|nr:DUF1697 domain-containing protein [Chitinophaga vietnamensis]